MNKFTKIVILQALDCTLAPTVIVDARKPGLPIAYVNPAVEALIGKNAKEVVGMPFAEILAMGRLPDESNQPDEASPEQATRTDRQTWHTRDGVSVCLDVRMSPLNDSIGRLSFWMFSVVAGAPASGKAQSHDTTALHGELVDARRQIKRLQRIDSVTGMANLGAFNDVLERDWAIARRDQRRIGLIVFSVDYLSEYRDIFGRHATDALLQKVGHAISGTLRRAGDFGARIESGRFAVLISDADEGQAEACATRIASKVRNLAIHHPRSAVARFATVSYGTVSELPAWTKESVTLLDEAGQQLDRNRQAAEKIVAESAPGEEEVVT